MSKISNLKKETDTKRLLIPLVVCFLGFLAFGLIVPYTHDDWAWGTQLGIDRLTSLFANYNGRWAGNLFILAMTRSRIVRGLVFAGSLTTIFYFGSKLLKTQKRSVMFLSSALLLMMPFTLFRETLSWTAGFANFVVSVAFLMPILYWMQKSLEAPDWYGKKKALILVSTLLLCFISQLFVEHQTLYMLVLAFCANLYYLKKYKKVNPLFLMVLVGAVAGAALMFSNGAYLSALAGDASVTYKETSIDSGIKGILRHAISISCSTVLPNLISNNLAVSLVLSALCLILLRKQHTLFGKLCKLMLFLFPAYLIAKKCMPYSLMSLRGGKFLEGFVALLFLFCVLYTVWMMQEIRWRGLFYIASIICLSAPLLVVTPIGPRNFFIIYIFLILLCGELLLHLLKNSKFAKAERPIARASMILCLVFVVIHFGIYGYASYSDVKRTASIKEQVAAGNQTIVVRELPFKKSLAWPTPKETYWKNNFKNFYGIPLECEIEFLPHKSIFLA